MLAEAEVTAIHSPVALHPTLALSTELVTQQGANSACSHSWPQGQSGAALCLSAGLQNQRV